MTDFCDYDNPDTNAHILHHLHRIERTMSSFSSDQAHLDSDVQAETADLSLIEAEIAALKAQPTSAALDFTGLDAAVARVKGDTPAATPAPVAAPVDPTSAAPASTTPVATSDPTTPTAAPTTDTPAPPVA